MQTLKRANSQGDFILQLAVIVLVLFGVAMQFSAGSYESTVERGHPFYYLEMGSAWAFLGLLGMFIIARKCTMNFWWKLAKPMLAGSILLLAALVFIPGFGTEINYAVRWIEVGPVTIMPGEIAKICAIIFVSWYLTQKPSNCTSTLGGTFPLVILCLIYGCLIMKQPNMSTAIILCGIIIGMGFVAGMKWRDLGCVAICGFALIMYIIKTQGTERSNRLAMLLDPFSDELNEGYQTVQSLVALGTGGLFGVGPGKSVAKASYLPEPTNDAILAVIGEELGYIGILLLLAVFMVLIWRCVRICIYAPDRFSMLVASGITIMLSLQVILNVAIITNTMIYTGVTLPFISYGGNAMLLFCWSMGIMLHISRHSIAPVPETRQPQERGY